MKRFFVFYILVQVVLLGWAKPNDTKDIDPFVSAAISYKVVDLQSGRTVDSLNPHIALTPASITKIVTTVAAVDILGTKFRFTTTIGTDGYLADDGTLIGNLIIRGDADPTLGSNYMGEKTFIELICAKIKAAGVKKIDGNVIVDALCLDENPTPGKWTFEDLTSHYGSGSYGLTLYDNVGQIALKSDANRGSITSITATSHIFDTALINNRVVVGNDNAVVIGTSPYNHDYVLMGKILPNQPSYLLRVAITDPPALAARYFCNALKNGGIEVTGKARVAKSRSDNWQQLAQYQSNTLKEILTYTNFKSNNLYAEHIYRRMGCTAVPLRASSLDSHRVVYSYLSKAGIDTMGLFLYDGCGLAPQNGMSAAFMCSLLQKAYNSSNKEVIMSMLPRAGKEGTVANFLRKTPLEGVARVKSGSMGGVQSYAGYIVLPNGKEYAFCVIVNNFVGSRANLRVAIGDMLIKSLKL